MFCYYCYYCNCWIKISITSAVEFVCVRAVWRVCACDGWQPNEVVSEYKHLNFIRLTFSMVHIFWLGLFYIFQLNISPNMIVFNDDVICKHFEMRFWPINVNRARKFNCMVYQLLAFAHWDTLIDLLIDIKVVFRLMERSYCSRYRQFVCWDESIWWVKTGTLAASKIELALTRNRTIN